MTGKHWQCEHHWMIRKHTVIHVHRTDTSSCLCTNNWPTIIIIIMQKYIKTGGGHRQSRSSHQRCCHHHHGRNGHISPGKHEDRDVHTQRHCRQHLLSWEHGQDHTKHSPAARYCGDRVSLLPVVCFWVVCTLDTFSSSLCDTGTYNCFLWDSDLINICATYDSIKFVAY